MAGGGGGDSRSLEQMPTWAVAVVCLGFILVSILIEQAIHLIGKALQKRHKKSLNEALEKIKAGVLDSLLIDAPWIHLPAADSGAGAHIKDIDRFKIGLLHPSTDAWMDAMAVSNGDVEFSVTKTIGVQCKLSPTDKFSLSGTPY
eukprot:Gb_08868 [translate_table: standard]